MPGSDHVTVVGAGAVGARVARELVSSGRREVSLLTARRDRAEVLVEAFGDEARIVVSSAPGDDLPADCGTVVLAGEAVSQPRLAASALERGCDVIAVTDDRACTSALIAMDELARARRAHLVIGAAFSPGLSCLLASFAGEGMDALDEVHVGRVGAGGGRCAQARRDALRQGGLQWREGEWVRTHAGSGRELTWFPEPVGARDCYLVGTAEPLLLRRRFPGLQRAVVRMSMNRRERVSLTLPSVGALAPLMEAAEGTVGAVRVEARGSLGGERSTTVLGAIDRPAVVCGALVAHLVEALDHRDEPPGARGLAEWAGPGALLAGLRDRGVRVAVTMS